MPDQLDHFQRPLLLLLLLLLALVCTCLTTSIAATASPKTNAAADYKFKRDRERLEPALQKLKDSSDQLQIDSARRLLAPGKGILAADESTTTMGKRFEPFGINNTASNRAVWRRALLTAPALQQHVSGVILTEETFYQPYVNDSSSDCSDSGSSSSSNATTTTTNGTCSSDSSTLRLATLLINRGIAAGVKVDKGLIPLANPGDTTCVEYGLCETQTQGLDGLYERCQRYRLDGATFVKWRAVLRVARTDTLGRVRQWPSDESIRVNAWQLAQFASIAQAANLVPIVEPEVLVMEGPHNILFSEAVSTRVLSAVVKALLNHNVLLEGIVLKPAMVLPGRLSTRLSNGFDEVCDEDDFCTAVGDVEAVAAATLRVLRRTVPPAVPGIAFLSGGQGERQAAEHLAAINAAAACGNDDDASNIDSSSGRAGGDADGRVQTQQRVCVPAPWRLTFSFGRALQTSALEAWARNPEDVGAVHEAFGQAIAGVAGAATAATAGGGGGATAAVSSGAAV